MSILILTLKIEVKRKRSLGRGVRAGLGLRVAVTRILEIPRFRSADTLLLSALVLEAGFGHPSPEDAGRLTVGSKAPVGGCAGAS
jgi:hypothetical protein